MIYMIEFHFSKKNSIKSIKLCKINAKLKKTHQNNENQRKFIKIPPKNVKINKNQK
jgi:hypothetical protein